METDNDDGIQCRLAMLELSLTYEGMAQFLGIDRTKVVKMCLDRAVLPDKYRTKVAILLNLHRATSPMKRQVTELAEDFVRQLHKRGGRLALDESITLSGLSGPQLKNVENIEQWISIVWEQVPGRGLHPFVYMTIHGYHQINVPYSHHLLVAPMSARSVTMKGLDEAQQTLNVAFNQLVQWHLQSVATIRDIQTMMAVGVTSVDQALEIYDAAVGKLPKPKPVRAIAQKRK